MTRLKSLLFLFYVLTCLFSCAKADEKFFRIFSESNFDDPAQVIEDFLLEAELMQHNLTQLTIPISFGEYDYYLQNLTLLVESLNQKSVIQHFNQEKLREITNSVLNILDSLVHKVDWDHSYFHSNIFLLLNFMNDFTPILNQNFIQNPNFADEFDVSISGIRLLVKPVELYSSERLSFKFDDDAQLDFSVKHLNLSVLSQQELNTNRSAVTVVLFDNLQEYMIKYFESGFPYVKMFSTLIYIFSGTNDITPALLLNLPHRISLLVKNLNRLQLGDRPSVSLFLSNGENLVPHACYYNQSMSNESFSQWGCNSFHNNYFINFINNRGNMLIDRFYSIYNDISYELTLYPIPTVKSLKKSMLKIEKFTSDKLSESELLQQVGYTLTYVANRIQEFLQKYALMPNFWLQQTNSQRLNSAVHIFKIVEHSSIFQNVKINYKVELNESSKRVSASRSAFNAMYAVQNISNKTLDIFSYFELPYYDYEISDYVKLCRATVPLSGLIHKVEKQDNLVAITATLITLREKNFARSYLSYGNFQIISAIISIVAEQTIDSKLLPSYRIHLNFTNLSPLVQTDNPKCGFYDSKLHQWSTQGCDIIPEESTKSHTICECDHFANSFAVLLNVNQQGDSFIEKFQGEFGQLQKNITTTGTVDQSILQDSLNSLRNLATGVTDKEVIHFTSYSRASSIVISSMSALDHLIGADQVWTNLTESERFESSRNIFKLVEDLSVLINSAHETQNTSLNFANLELQTQTISFTSGENQIKFEFDDSSVEIPTKSLPNQDESQIVISATTMRNNSLYATSNQTLMVNSPIISIIIGDERESVNLVQPFKINLRMIKPITTGENPNCVFWDSNDEKWSTDGCSYAKEQSNRHYTVCECNHLTTFAVLIERKEPAEVINDVTDNLENLASNITSSANITQDQWQGSLDDIGDSTSSITEPGVLEHVNRTIAVSVTKNSLTVLNALIEQPQVLSNLSQSEITKSVSSIFRIVEDLSILLHATQNESLTQFDNFSSIHLETKTFEAEVGGMMDFQLRNEFLVEIPFDGLNLAKYGIRRSDPIVSTAASIRSVSQYLSFEGHLLVNSEVLSLLIGSTRDRVKLNPPNRFRFISKNQNPTQFRDKLQCNYWEFEVSNWSPAGCYHYGRKSNLTYTVCECDHLSNFAVLADVANREKPNSVKSYLTYACAGVSVLFLVLTICVLLKNHFRNTVQNDPRKMKANRSSLLLSICGWMIVTNLLVVFGLDRTESKPICDMIAVVLLFSLLSTFSFTLMLSIHLYMSTSIKHLTTVASFRSFALLAYSFPILVMAISFILIYFVEFDVKISQDQLVPDLLSFHGVWNKNLGFLSGDYFCWISSREYPMHIWVFLAPLTCIVVTNLLILCRIIPTVKKINTMRQMENTNLYVKSEENQIRKKRLLAKMISYLILIVNFGIPWILYLFYIEDNMAVVFSYVFIVINGTQGIALFAEQYYHEQTRKQQQKLSEQQSSSTIANSTTLSSTLSGQFASNSSVSK